MARLIPLLVGESLPFPSPHARRCRESAAAPGGLPFTLTWDAGVIALCRRMLQIPSFGFPYTSIAPSRNIFLDRSNASWC